jgi:choice-of-anchor B domain-containing protein
MPLLAPLAVLVAVQAAEPSPPARIELTPSPVELEVGDSLSLELAAFAEDGSRLEPVEVRWLALTPSRLAVTDRGVVSALRSGDGRLAVVVNGRTFFHEVRVPPLPPHEVVTEPAGPVLTGIYTPLEVRVLDELGDPVPGVRVRFASADTAVARVDAEGRIAGVRAGATTIRVAAGDASADVPVRVAAHPPGGYEVVASADAVRTGDVVRLKEETVGDDGGRTSVSPRWTLTGVGAQVETEGGEGVFVAERPGTYRVAALVGPGAVVETTIEVAPREHLARVEVVGHGAIGAHHSGDTWVFEGADGRDYAYVGTFLHDWMKVWDVTDPAAPALVDSLQLDARRINDVKIHPNNRVGILTREGAASRRNGIVILDLSQPAHPRILSEYTETVSGGVHNVWIRGEENLVYACHNGTGSLHIIDISDPAAPREVGRWGLDKPFKTLHDVIVQDGYAYLSYWDDGAVVLDVGAGTHGGTPTEPAFVSSYAYPQGNTHVAWRDGRYLFVGDEIFPDDWDADRPIEARGYVHVLDMTDIDRPREVARYEVPEAGAHNVWVEDDRLYVGYYQAGLRVVDVSGELRGDLYRQGREIGYVIPLDDRTTVANWPMTWGAQVFKGNVFTSDLNSGLWVVKVVDERPVS